jgi:flavin reductase (DIM6/NTAB) family NADH-FMN oxidoreductase RutF
VLFDSRRFRDALGQFPTGIVVVTADAPSGERIGMTVSSFNSVSLDPPLVLFSVLRRANSFAAWQGVTRYAINVLSEEQEELSNRFARAMGDKWVGLPPLRGEAGLPILPNTLATFECEAFARHEGGDHEIFVGRVLAVRDNVAKRGRPLVFFDGRYRRVAQSDGGHVAPDEGVFLHGW